MPRILIARHAVPPHVVSQQVIKEAARVIFAGKIPNLERHLAVFDRSRIERRALIRPLEWYLQPHSPAERNAVFLTEGLALLRQAVGKCLAAAELSAAQIDHLIYVNTTGHATPSLDARLINELDFSPQTSRLPIWGLGCAAGAAGLSRARDYCLAHPRARVLLTALECCSLTLMPEDLSKKNLIGVSLFADGAAAVLVVGDEVAGSGPELVDSYSRLFPDSYQIMGWEFRDAGMELVLSPRLPALLKAELPQLLEDFLQRCGLRRQDLRHYVTHPGGARVLDAVQQALGLSAEQLRFSSEFLRDYGNLSSVSVLVVLEKWLASNPAEQPGFGLLAGFGPGFSAELLLLQV